MNIDRDILLAWGGRLKKFHKNEFIFMEGDTARCYHQIIEGSVRMYNVNDNAGKEFTQGTFSTGDSFGEPPVITGDPYPANAVAQSESLIILVPRESFIKILHEYADLHFKFTETLAKRLYSKAQTFKEIMNNSPQTRIIGFLNSFKKREHPNTLQRVQVPFTRQEIANFTGLRVETVIRTLIKMSEDNIVEINERKLYY